MNKLCTKWFKKLGNDLLASRVIKKFTTYS
jgi:hypothetical protein